jgi:hypothetical protein
MKEQPSFHLISHSFFLCDLVHCNKPKLTEHRVATSSGLRTLEESYVTGEGWLRENLNYLFSTTIQLKIP